MCWVLEEEILELFRFVKGKCVGFFKRRRFENFHNTYCVSLWRGGEVVESFWFCYCTERGKGQRAEGGGYDGVAGSSDGGIRLRSAGF